MWTHRGLSHLLGWWALLSFVLTQAQDCSSSTPCATGCCSKDGYCGVGEDYCGADVCVASCDYKPDCDASNPCETGCCNKFGYCGLGPDYCDAEVCVAGCESKSYCDPGGFGKFSEVSKCPLNVCCSKFGFCGLTEEFCGKKKVKRPSCSTRGYLDRVVGYYEGWSVKRPCNVFYPEQIPVGVYTHLNYAFAAIDPETFEIQPASTYEGDLMKRLTSIKKIDPDLRVFIAIGGWTFNDPGPTATVFSDLARSTDNQKKFFKSLTSFLAEYNFDGVDLDWEYPAADDRSGRKEDFKNFPKFMANLKDALKKTGGRDGLSITLPASYWYLQHFDIVELEKHVDFFNMMTYDLHGTWDKGNEWLGAYLLSHTNLTEIENGLDLLWRNDISPDKVVLGMGFYARAFTVSDTGCMDTGCMFESGANPGKCSHETGILLNSEIMDIMKDGNLKSELDKKAAVKILKYDTNQWLTYDDGDTFKLKTDFARSQCLGGVMVWAVSHDTEDAKFSRALSEVTDRTAVALAMTSEDSSTVSKNHPQCKWTNCGESCPSGWAMIMRSDKGHRKNELMWDETACGGAGSHQFCCPPDAELPTCGWYTHHNGKCDPECPDGMVEVASNRKYCNNGKYQAACCTTGSNSTKLYGQCSWSAEWPDCDSGSCSNTEIASSTSGSGAVQCDARKLSFEENIFEFQERKYCCDGKDDKQWENCEWHDDLGNWVAGQGVKNGYCLSGCPSDTVRVAMSDYGGRCRGWGARAKCCKSDYNTITKRAYTDAEEDLADLVQEFMEDQICGSNSWYDKREVDFHLAHGNLTALPVPMALTRRASLKSQEKMEDLLRDVAISYGASVAKQEIWDKYVVSEYQHLTRAKLRSWFNGQIAKTPRGYPYLIETMICNMPYYNAVIGDKEVVDCACETGDCCDAGDDYCSSDNGNDYTELGLFSRSLDKRAGPRPFDITFSDGVSTLHFESLGYWSRGQVPVNHPLMQLGFDLVDESDCLLPDIAPTALTTTTRSRFAVEHELELNTIRQFIIDAENGVLRSGATARVGSISISFFVRAMDAPILNNPPPMLGGGQSSTPIVRIMNALGSTANNGHFVFFLNGLNTMKLAIWVGNNPVNENRMTTAVQADNPENALRNLRNVLSIIFYLNHPIAHDNWVGPANDVRAELARVETEWLAQGNPREQLVAYWDEWLRDFMTGRATRIRNWVQTWAREMYKYWAVRTGDVADQTLQTLRTLNSLASDLEIDLDGLHQEPLDLD